MLHPLARSRTARARPRLGLVVAATVALWSFGTARPSFAAGPSPEANEATPAPPEESGAEASLSPELESAKAIYQRGVADYTAGRYEQAVELWLEAYNALPTSYETSKIRAELIYNIATAQKKAFDIDEDLAHLRQARASLQNFADSIDEAYPEGPERDREREQVQRVLAEIERQIDDVQAARQKQAQELAALSRPDFDPVLDARLAKQNRNLIVGGGVLAGIGALGLGTMGVGIALGSRAERNVGALNTNEQLEERRALIRQGSTANALAFTGGVVGSITAIAGASMLGVGLKRERRRKSYRADERDAQLRVGPLWHDHTTGISLRGAF